MAVVQPPRHDPQKTPPAGQHNTDATVKRRSLMDAAKQKPQPLDDNLGTSSHLPITPASANQPSLTTTSTFTARALNTTGVFRITGDEQTVQSTQMDAIQPESSWMELRGPLTPQLINDSVVLVVPSKVYAEEIEALAVSLFDDVAWRAPGTLRLHHHADLEGPYSVDKDMSDYMGTRRTNTRAYILRCPQHRSGPLPPELLGASDYQDIFRDDLPTGLEDAAIRAVIDIATRLMGQVCVMRDTAANVINPDPDANTNLTVFAPQGIDAVTAVELLEDILPGLDDASLPDINTSDPRLERRHKNVEADIIAHLDPEAVKQAQQLAAAAADAPPPPAPSPYEFALRAPAENIAAIYLESAITDYTPPALRWEPWAQGNVVMYQFRWEPYDAAHFFTGRITRRQRVSRTRAARQIEQAAVALAVLTGGVIVDQMGFLVGYDTAE